MIAPWRRATQTAGLLLLVAIPLLNRYGVTAVQGGYQSLGVGPLWFVSPLGLVGRELMSAVLFGAAGTGIGVIVAILLLNLVTRRLFCRGFCPLGGLLAGLGRARVFGIRHAGGDGSGCGGCDRACPLGLEPSRGEGAAARCWNCGRCVDACASGSLQLTRGRPAVRPTAHVAHPEKYTIW